jgi:hypothetical protein
MAGWLANCPLIQTRLTMSDSKLVFLRAMTMAVGIGLALPVSAVAADAAASAPAAKPRKTAAKPAAKTAVAAKPQVADVPPEPATPEQVAAAERVFYGDYQCEFKQMVYVKASEQHPAYVELKHGTSTYLMKPVVSPTGAVRLEDIKNNTLMVQISSKSMLMNVTAGTRMLDGCVSPKQRELMAGLKQALGLEAQATQATPKP